jgi:hypothetical protein
MLASALTGSSKNITPNREKARSIAPGAKGMRRGVRLRQTDVVQQKIVPHPLAGTVEHGCRDIDAEDAPVRANATSKFEHRRSTAATDIEDCFSDGRTGAIQRGVQSPMMAAGHTSSMMSSQSHFPVSPLLWPRPRELPPSNTSPVIPPTSSIRMKPARGIPNCPRGTIDRMQMWLPDKHHDNQRSCRRSATQAPIAALIRDTVPLPTPTVFATFLTPSPATSRVRTAASTFALVLARDVRPGLWRAQAPP